jgi:hypothetical protein
VEGLGWLLLLLLAELLAEAVYALQNALLCPGGQLVPGALFPASEPRLEQDGYRGLSQCAVLPAPPLLPLLLLVLPDESDPDDPELSPLTLLCGPDPELSLLTPIEGVDAYTIVVVVIELVSINVAETRHKTKLTENLLLGFYSLISNIH